MHSSDVFSACVFYFCLALQSLSFIYVYRFTRGLRSMRSQVQVEPAPEALVSRDSECDLSTLLSELMSENSAIALLAWNELTLLLNSFSARLRLFQRSLPRIHVFSAFACAALSWLGSKSIEYSFLTILSGFAGAGASQVFLRFAEQEQEQILKLLKPIERQIIRQQKRENAA